MKHGAVYAALVFIIGVYYMDKLKPRGIRNNNPLNIRDNPNNLWRGRIGKDDKSFVIFNNVEYGFRAAARILRSYARRNVVTLESIIAAWSPPVGIDADGNEYTNPTESYINGVSEKTGIARNSIVKVEDYPLLLSAMTHHENGQQPFSMDVITKGVNLA